MERRPVLMAMASVLPTANTFAGRSRAGAGNIWKPSFPLSSSQSFPSSRSAQFLRMYAQPPSLSEFDTAAFEAERLRLDEQARNDMMQVAQAAEEAESKTGSSPNVENGAGVNDEEDPGAWKWRIRKRIWDLMERENIAAHPRPVHHRIPNFVGAAAAASKLASLPAFQAAKCVKVNPDTPQKQVRYLTLQGNKKLLTPQPRLRSGFFSEIEASSLPPGVMAEACTAAGVAKYGKPLGLDAKLKVDLIVIGSVAVNPKTGARLGKGEGFAELEYAMLRHMGAIDDSTLVVTSVHDKQLVDDIPTDKLKVHDVPVDVICTPTHIIQTNTTIPKPEGIYWELLSPEKLGQILVLRQLKKQIEETTGEKLPTGPSEKLPPTAERRPLKQPGSYEKTGNEPCIFVWSLDISTTWRDVKEHASKEGAEVVRVNVFRKGSNSRPMARILFKEGTEIESLVKALDKSELRGSTIRAKVNSVPESSES
ncbi:hypothetical protein GOP47_0007457 [Adiantum capillus-veneris]|uniref:Methenyltetrahydrofolate synthase domain-containing protein n=1 Tax=Adiantum capillus-veneris TaxID=13818 RepID=A0A9D4ZJ86_ADICA|nr:hypothetical protein GOP47_0007457 [Adiantum capillus-veneris]